MSFLLSNTFISSKVYNWQDGIYVSFSGFVPVFGVTVLDHTTDVIEGAIRCLFWPSRGLSAAELCPAHRADVSLSYRSQLLVSLAG